MSTENTHQADTGETTSTTVPTVRFLNTVSAGYYERTEGIKNLISGVPNNGQAPFSLISCCSDYVKRISIKDTAKTILKNVKNDDDGLVLSLFIALWIYTIERYAC